jgi:biopolymer transport protein ExbD
MRFHVRKRRQAPAVIIVALIDILIVLLIFLMVSTAFKQQPALKINLPEASQAQRSGAQETPPLIVTIDPQGNYRLGVNGRPVTLDQFRADLIAEVAKTPDLKLAISGDEGAPWGRVAKVMDAARAAGVKGVNALTKEPPKQ